MFDPVIKITPTDKPHFQRQQTRVVETITLPIIDTTVVIGWPPRAYFCAPHVCPSSHDVMLTCTSLIFDTRNSILVVHSYLSNFYATSMDLNIRRGIPAFGL